MVPDFLHLRKRQSDLAASQSSAPSNSRGFDSLKSSQQFDKHSFLSTLSQIEHGFFALWTTCPSWSPVLKKPSGWITIVNPSGKKVPLVLGSIESHYRRDYIIGKRFGKLTNYLMIDVDRNSPFHPCNGGIKPILDAMEALGLCRYLVVRSSSSGGIHIYFPLAEPVSAWGLACAAHAALTAAGVRVAGGVCELFPNKKAFRAEHNGHRLPLQQGSFLLDDDFRCIGNDKAAFLVQWQHCAARQDEMLLAAALMQRPRSMPLRVSVRSLPPIAWTGPGQSNEVMKELVNFGDRYLNLKTIPTLGGWIVEVAPQLQGFEQFASKESKNDLTRKNWAYRWAKSHFKSARQHRAKSSYDHNATVAAEALERLKIALNKLVVVGRFGVKKLWLALSTISKELFGVGFSWGLFQKHRKLIMAKVRSICEVGLSRSSEEDKNSSSEKLAVPSDSGAGGEPKKLLPELLTARWVTSTSDTDLSASRTPSEQEDKSGAKQVEAVEAAPEEATELAMGAVVSVQHSGSDVEGVQTRVTGKVTALDGKLLYRLEHCVEGQPLMLPGDCLVTISDKQSEQKGEGVIQATAAQLLKVLGKACPFFGPGLWTVKREEVSPLAWRQLAQLVGEM
ncbi:hypothetical protein [cf. Phormidesmis sp. LEGE 11477]|uniref:hypothetical protein n=1 Tax=cf. Phormidesmis sp. LEGE 11477 TaxID=1828680 RepID=UPI001882AD7E|nr:hypothetical protein [cf. Phormidesmis sp. LEGE 11477]MBE9063206.1 hypothetical protein [cf. Phormidesmis sp. LEGE 11477]